MTQINGALAPSGPACLKKVSTPFSLWHPECAKPLLSPLFTEDGAETGRQAMRNSEGTVTTSRARDILRDDQTTHIDRCDHLMMIGGYAPLIGERDGAAGERSLLVAAHVAQQLDARSLSYEPSRAA